MTLLEALLEQKKNGGDLYYKSTKWTLSETSADWSVQPAKPIAFEDACKLMVEGNVLQDDYGQLWKIKRVSQGSPFINLYALLSTGGNAPNTKMWLRTEFNAELPKFVRIVPPGEVV